MQGSEASGQYVLVRNHLGEAIGEVAELRRLLAEAERRRYLVETGQGDLGWWDSILVSFARWIWGGHSRRPRPSSPEAAPAPSHGGIEMSF